MKALRAVKSEKYIGMMRGMYLTDNNPATYSDDCAFLKRLAEVASLKFGEPVKIVTLNFTFEEDK